MSSAPTQTPSECVPIMHKGTLGSPSIECLPRDVSLQEVWLCSVICHQPSGPTNYTAYNILMESVETSQGKEQSSPKTKSTELSNHWFPGEFWLYFWFCPPAQKSHGLWGHLLELDSLRLLRTALPPLCPSECGGRATTGWFTAKASESHRILQERDSR